MTSSADWGRLTIYVDEARQWRRRSLVAEIVFRAREGKLRGASVRSGIAGFGDGGTVRRESVLPIVQHLPAEIVLVDDMVVLQAFLTRLDRMQGVLLVTLQPVEVVDTSAGASRDTPEW
ncbi:DUF190 domain-containing protein [Streptomyces mirabilis]|uniref:DUF190 domain-containing protein n=1 Tax=Streptomyces mirabilis TaxID=68239 RepID=UPI00367A8DE3